MLNKKKRLMIGGDVKITAFGSAKDIRINDITLALKVLKAYKLQLDHLGYYVNGNTTQTSLSCVIHSKVNFAGKVKQEQGRERLQAAERCYQALNSNFKEWGNLDRYLNRAKQLIVDNSSSEGMCFYTATFYKIIKRLKQC